MGEAKRRSRKRDAILAACPKCIYCDEQATTIEHAPPISMFAKRDRPSGLEFPCCQKCNFDSRASDAAAAFFARIAPEHRSPDWQLNEANRLLSTLSQLAPGSISEIFKSRDESKIWARDRTGIYGPMHKLQITGPIVHSLMVAFVAKFGMALFYEHCGKRLSSNGGVYTQHYFNIGINQKQADTMLGILPLGGTLTQGRKSSSGQFGYRYNTDKKSIFACFASFHDNLFVRAIATNEPDKYRFLLDEHNAGFVPFGGLKSQAAKWGKSASTLQGVSGSQR